jgi:hypothetical protein
MIHRFDASQAKCAIFTYKEGLLAAIVPGLKLEAGRFECFVDADTPRFSLRVDARSLRAVCVMRNGQEQRGGLSVGDRERIDQALVGEVLRADLHPTIAFTSTMVTQIENGFALEGDLSLRGATRQIAAQTRQVGRWQVAELDLCLPDFGILPITALAGAIRVKPRLSLAFSVPFEAESACRGAVGQLALSISK